MHSRPDPQCERLYAAKSFAQFWPEYLAVHDDRRVRRAHAVGTSVAYGMIATGLVTAHAWPIVVGPLAGHAVAQWSHRHYQKIRTAPGRRPLWHLRAELRLFRQTLALELHDARDRSKAVVSSRRSRRADRGGARAGA